MTAWKDIQSVAHRCHHGTIIIIQIFCLWSWSSSNTVPGIMVKSSTCGFPSQEWKNGICRWFVLSSLYASLPLRHWIIFSFLSSRRWGVRRSFQTCQEAQTEAGWLSEAGSSKGPAESLCTQKASSLHLASGLQMGQATENWGALWKWERITHINFPLDRMASGCALIYSEK